MVMKKAIENKKIAMIIAFRNFQDMEYFIPRDIFTEAKAKIITVSQQMGTALGVNGGEAEVNLENAKLQVEDFDAVVFIGGPGMGKRIDDENLWRVARETVAADRILGAICIAPALLAKAGVLKEKKATVWSSPLDKSPIRMLVEGGAIYKDKDVVVDDKIVTANGPAAAKKFAETIIKVFA